MSESRVILRRPRDGDAEARQALGRHPDVLRGFGVIADTAEAMPIDDARKWIGRLRRNVTAWVIEHAGRLIGEIRLDNLNSDDRTASMAVAIYDPRLLGRGLGTEAIGICLYKAFSELGLHRISVRVLATNERAVACYRKCGFLIEGRE